MISTETWYWLIGITALILLTFTYCMGVLTGFLGSKKWGATPLRDLHNDKTIFVDVSSMKDATTVGFKLIQERYGPGGVLSKWITIPDPFLVRDSDGKVEKIYTPRDLHIKQVMGFCEIEAGKLTETEMYAAEYFVRWQEERVRNIAEIDKQADAHIKRLGEAVPYAGLKTSNKYKGGGDNSGYNSRR